MRRMLTALLVVLLACGPAAVHAQTVTQPVPPAAPAVPDAASPAEPPPLESVVPEALDPAADAAAPAAAPAADAAPAGPAPETAPTIASADYYPIVIGLGALAGVVGFNLVALGVGALPGGAAYAGGMMVPAEMSVAMSRVYAVGSAVAGAWIANHLYSAE